MNQFYNWMPQAQQQVDEKIWVQGEDAARAYLVTANGFVRLWDSTQNVFYEKRADASGRPYMDAYKYEAINREKNSFTNLEERIKHLEEMMNHANESNADDTGV